MESKKMTIVGELSYNKNGKLGEGRFSIVFSGLYLSRPVAIKRFQKASVDESVFKREVDLMIKASNHNNILGCLHTEMNDDDFL